MLALFARIFEADPTADHHRKNRPPEWLEDLALWLHHSVKKRTLRLPQIAAQAGLSVSRLCHLFHRHYGESPMAFVRRERVALAVGLMRTQPERALADIAHCCGFADQPQFSRHVRSVLGCSPRTWRARQTAIADSGARNRSPGADAT